MLVVMKSIKYIMLGLSIFAIVACSSTPEVDDGYKGVYGNKSSSSKSDSLEVPPDLTSPDLSRAMNIPSLSSSDSSYHLQSGSGSSSVLPQSTSGVRFVRDGRIFWLEIGANPDDIWGDIRNFYKDLGFSFVRDEPLNGLLETNWLENRFDVPTGWFSSMVGGLFSTGLKDKFRIRIERSSDKENVILLFVTHQGLKETVIGDSSAYSDVTTAWIARESDPDLEAEMLQRFLVFRGVSKTLAKQTIPTKQSKSVERATLEKAPSAETYVINVDEIFPRTWRRISIALDRMGLVIVDRNRSKGIYYIKTTEDFVKGEEEEQSWISSLFSSTEKLTVSEYKLIVDDEDSKTVISLMNDAGEKDTSKTGYFILKSLQEHLR